MTKQEIMKKSITYYIDHKISCIPVGRDKKPLVNWKIFQERFPTEQEIDQWLVDFPDMELGWVTGKISNIIVVDVENGWDVSWLPKTAIVQTGGGWFHYYYSYVEWMTNKVRIKDLTDIRSDWGYVVLPPSISDKWPYKWLVKTPPIPFPLSLFGVETKDIVAPVDISWYEGFGEGQRNNEMARYIWAVLVKTHPSVWETIAWNLAEQANQKNSPPLSQSELRSIFDSIVNMERRNKSDRWYKKNEEESKESSVWKEEENKVMLLSEISKKEEYQWSERYSTGISLIDESTNGGFQDWDLIIISGQSGYGKTTCAQSIAVNMAEQWLPVLFFSYEVLVSHLWKKFVEMWATDDLPIYSVEKHTTGNVGWIQEKLKEAKEKFWIKVVVIDHLGFLIPKHKLEASGNYATYVGQVMRELKTLAKDEKIIIILPVHVRKSDDPGMNDLKDSSAISQESDMVLMLNRERNYDEESEQYYSDHTKLYSVKNRSTGVNFQGWFTLQDGKFVQDHGYMPLPKPKAKTWNKF